jgi:hypothetical protein
MGARLNNLKSKVKDLIKYRRVSKFPAEIDYDTVLKNHAVLINAYGVVLKNDMRTLKLFFRSPFIESHIYKKLRLLREIYLAEVAALYNTDKAIIKSTLIDFVEDIDRFLGTLFNFSLEKILLSSIPIIATIIYILSTLRDFFLGSWSLGLRFEEYLLLIRIVGLFFLIYLGFATLSFIDKRLFFIFTDNKAQGYFDLWKKRLKAFLGINIKGTIYEKETKLFRSLGIAKEPETPIDIILFFILFTGVTAMLSGLSIFIASVAENLSYLLLLFFFFLLIKRATSNTS